MDTLEHAPEDTPAVLGANGSYAFFDSSPDPLGSTGPTQSLASSSSSASPLPNQDFTQPGEDVTQPAAVFFDKPKGAKISVRLPSSTLVTPKSAYDGYEPPLPPSREHDAVQALMATTRSTQPSQGFVDFELSEFTFYADSKNYPKEMRSLHQFSTKNGHDKFYFDGVLSAGDVRHYVTRVEVCELPIGNYGKEHASVDDQVWVRSSRHKKRDLEVYYRLTKPAHEYKRFFYPFLWVANLAKHVVDFAASIHKKREIDMDLFREEFYQWLIKTHGEGALKTWLAQHPSHDFRTSIMANLKFIWKEANGVLGDRGASLSLFREAMYFNEYPIERTPLVPAGGMVRGDKGEEEYPTIVTPYIKECFGHMVIGKMLRLAGEDAGILLPSFPAATELGMAASTATRIPDIASKVHVGDVISTPRDDEDSGTTWKPMASRNFVDDGRWFGLVQKVHMTARGRRTFDIAWLYRPSETPCCVMKYPWPNELFLSDHCTCEEGASARIQEQDVIDIHPINWFGTPEDSGGRLFIRQLYMVDERRWVTLQPNHLQCAHEHKKLGYKVGDTLLAASSEVPDVADPVEVVRIFKQATSNCVFVRLRKFRRRTADKPDAPKNELVWTDEYVVKKTTDLHYTGKCHIRFFASTELIPSPYNRGGTGNLFFITHKLVDGRCTPFDGEYPPLKQGFDPRQEVVTKLKGLDLFCGAGNFGRGLEDGGVIDMCWTNDIWDRAMHTYMANQHKGKTHAFLGSVDYLFQAAVEGKFSEQVPRPGEVDFISAGSPCPGFSLLTLDKTTLHQIKNQSLVASFASFVDFYRPKYGVLENVASIVQAKHNRKEDVLSQLFCALVGMGYQAQLILGDAWAHGAPQSRTRVFLYFAAPGLRLPEAPLASHSNHPGANSRGLGEMCNGEPFVRRAFEPTAFKYVSVEEAAGDLPEIADAKPDCCVPFPDHRVSVGMTTALVRGSSTSKGFGLLYQVPTIPIHPYGLNFAKAWNGGRGVMSEGDRALFPAGSARVSDIAQGWSRVHPRLVFKTITTAAQPTCARTGAGLHWNQPRPLSLMEVRRAQGFLDEEVLLGSTSDQWKLVGNSVARPMAVALGLKFREAWLGSLYDGRTEVCRPRNPVARTNVQAIVFRAKSETVSGATTPSDYVSVDDGEMKGEEFTPATVFSDLEVPRRKRTTSLEPSGERPVKLRRQLDDEDPKMILLSRQDFKARREEQSRRESEQSRRESQSRSRSESVSMLPGGAEAEVLMTTTITTTTTLAMSTTFTTKAAIYDELMETESVEAAPVETAPVERKINGMTVICID